MLNSFRAYSSVRQAAGKLGVTTSHVYMLIRALDDEQVIRTPLGVLVTPAGMAALAARDTRKGRKPGQRRQTKT